MYSLWVLDHWIPKVCKIIAFWAALSGFGPLFYILRKICFLRALGLGQSLVSIVHLSLLLQEVRLESSQLESHPASSSSHEKVGRPGQNPWKRCTYTYIQIYTYIHIHMYLYPRKGVRFEPTVFQVSRKSPAQYLAKAAGEEIWSILSWNSTLDRWSFQTSLGITFASCQPRT